MADWEDAPSSVEWEDADGWEDATVEDEGASLWESVKARAGEATGAIYQGAGYALGGLMAPFEALATGKVWHS